MKGNDLQATTLSTVSIHQIIGFSYWVLLTVSSVFFVASFLAVGRFFWLLVAEVVPFLVAGCFFWCFVAGVVFPPVERFRLLEELDCRDSAKRQHYNVNCRLSQYTTH